MALAEFLCRRWLPEVSDTHILHLDKVTDKYHHPIQSEVEEPRSGASPRILFIGDSFTYGYGLPDRNFTYPRLVRRALAQGEVAGVLHPDAQVFNISAVSYSPSIYGAILQDFLDRLRPDLVVLAVDDSDPQDDALYRDMLARDAEGVPVSVYPRLPCMPLWLVPAARRLKLIRLVHGLLVVPAMVRAGFIRLPERAIVAWENRYGHLHDGAEGAWRPAVARTLELIDASVRLCRKRGVRVALLNYPYAPAVSPSACASWRKQFGLEAGRVYSQRFHGAQRAYAAAEGIPYYDFTDFLLGRRDLHEIYREVDGHFTKKGNTLLARELVRFLGPVIGAGPGGRGAQGQASGSL